MIGLLSLELPSMRRSRALVARLLDNSRSGALAEGCKPLAPLHRPQRPDWIPIAGFGKLPRIVAASFLTTLLAGSAALSDPVAPAIRPKESSGVYTPKSNVQMTPMRVVVLDGVTFRDIESGNAFRLYGVDACAADQSATLGRQSWPCGAVASAWLVGVTLGKWTACNIVSEIDGVAYSRCSTSEHPDIALDMLKEGQAVAVADPAGKRLHAYAEAEAEARKNFRGLWASQFQFPWDFRKARGLATAAPAP